MAEKNTIINVNNYIPFYPTYKDNLDDTLLRNKYEKIRKNKKEYFNKANIINFDIINHESRGDELQHSKTYYETIYKEDLQRAKEDDQDEFISEAIKSRREDLRINKDVMNEHFKLTPELIKFKQKNKSLFSSMHGRKNKYK